ncbi:MAG: thioredoxin-disulfide reductase [Bacteroidales bacterium]|nr:thioredoxin-disulfide reductase [Bacteroidales bacterium]MBP5612581.1 thioredoxin-disulfide reductase [Bacteroidales bacterium]
MSDLHTKCLIIGSGPAGYTAAIYASRANLKPILYEGMQSGGQLTITSMVENFPGYPEGRMGGDIMNDIRLQAERFGADIRPGEILSVDFSQRPFRCTADDGTTILAGTVIIATGASARWLGLPSEKEYNGSGVSTCATCDGFFYKGKDVAVIGGGDTAAEDATYLAGLCRKVYMVHRRNQLRASSIMQEKIFRTPNIEMVWNHIPIEITGEGDKFSKSVTGLRIQDVQTKEEKNLKVDGVFVAIGHHPNTEIFEGQLELDEENYIVTRPGTSITSVPGVFAAGDVQDRRYKQAITAAAGGCRAAIDAERFLQEC